MYLVVVELVACTGCARIDFLMFSNSLSRCERKLSEDRVMMQLLQRRSAHSARNGKLK
jgi:hypothetical protein